MPFTAFDLIKRYLYISTLDCLLSFLKSQEIGLIAFSRGSIIITVDMRNCRRVKNAGYGHPWNAGRSGGRRDQVVLADTENKQ